MPKLFLNVRQTSPNFCQTLPKFCQDFAQEALKQKIFTAQELIPKHKGFSLSKAKKFVLDHILSVSKNHCKNPNKACQNLKSA